MGVTLKLEDKDKGLLKAFKTALEIKYARVKVGVLASSPQGGAPVSGPGGVEGAASGQARGITVAQLASILEFGTEDGHIPPRPALGSTFDRMHGELVEMGKKLIKAALDGKITVSKGLNILGAKLANEVKKSITAGAGVPPPNAPSTIRQKGSSRPWVDTGRTVGAITWQVQDGSEKGNEEK